jgi:hypothetical protein
MTSREIAQAVGKSERRVQEWARMAGAKIAGIGAKIAEAKRVGKAADYDLAETCQIIEAGLGKAAAGIFRANALRGLKPLGSPSPVPLGEDRLNRLEALVQQLVSSVFTLVGSPTAGKPAIGLLASGAPPPPDLSPRAALRKVVESWARAHGRDYHEAWAGLYREYDYRYRRDIRAAARGRGLSILDYADDEDLLGQLLALAYHLYGHVEAS